MKVIANRQLYSSAYGSRHTGEEFDPPHYIATELLKRGLVCLPTALTYAVKAIQPAAPIVEVEHSETRSVANKRR